MYMQGRRSGYESGGGDGIHVNPESVCAKLVDIRTCIENDRLVTSLVYCAIYAQFMVLRALGGASYRTGIILVVVRMAPPATTSSALAHLVHRQWFIMHPWTRVDRWGTGGRVPTLFIHACVDYAC